MNSFISHNSSLSTSLAYLENLIDPRFFKIKYHDFVVYGRGEGGHFSDDEMEFEFQNGHDLPKGDPLIETLKFKDEIMIPLKEECQYLFKKVNIQVSKLEDSVSKTSSLNGIFDSLLYYISILKKSPDSFYGMSFDICDLLLHLAHALKNRHMSLISLSSHSLFTPRNEGLENLNQDGFLGYKGTMRSIRILYNGLTHLQFFSQDLDQLEKFTEILSANSKSNINNHLQIDCSNEKAAYIIQKLQPLFYNFKLKDAELFLKTSRGSRFKANSISKANSTSKHNPSLDEFKENVDRFLQEFIRKFC